MIRFYAYQAGYLPKGRKIAVLAQENRADEMEKMQDKQVSLWNEKGKQTAVKQAVYAGVDESAEDKVWHIDFSDLTEEGTVTFQDGEGAVLGSCIISRKAAVKHCISSVVGWHWKKPLPENSGVVPVTRAQRYGWKTIWKEKKMQNSMR